MLQDDDQVLEVTQPAHLEERGAGTDPERLRLGDGGGSGAGGEDPGADPQPLFDRVVGEAPHRVSRSGGGRAVAGAVDRLLLGLGHEPAAGGGGLHSTAGGEIGSAARIVTRDTPYCAARVRSDGSRSPGFAPPAAMSAHSRAATWAYNGSATSPRSPCGRGGMSDWCIPEPYQEAALTAQN